MKPTLKKSILGVIPVLVLIGIITFFTADIAYSLYEPDRAAPETPECSVAALHGDLSIMARDGLNWVTYDGTTTMEPGSRLRTSTESQAFVTFSSGTTTTLEPGTDLIIDTITPQNGTIGDSVLLKQRSGKTWNQVEAREIPQDFILKTTSAELKAEGTSFSAEINDDGSTIVTSMEGRVQVSAAGETVNLDAGYMTLVEEGEPPREPYPIPAACNELSFSTGTTVHTLVTSPEGTSTGMAEDGTVVNQINAALLASTAGETETVYLREPVPGNYTITSYGVPDSTFNLRIEGFINGESAFIKSEEITMSPTGKKVLYFAYSESAAGIEPVTSGETGTNEPPEAAQAAVRQPAGVNNGPNAEANADGESSSTVVRWIVITFIIIIAGGLFYWVRQN